jgi:hypothetical protein
MAEYAYNLKIYSSHDHYPIKVAYRVKPKGFNNLDNEH